MKSAGLVRAAVAQNVPDKPAAMAALPSAPAQGVSPPSMRVTNWTDRPPPPPICKPNPLAETGERKILLDLKRREAALDAWAAALDRQEQELAATKAALRRQIASLKPLAAKLAATKAQHRSVDTARWNALVATYAAMEPRSAARIFDGLDPAVVLNVLRRMNSRKSASILAVMVPRKARVITEKMAGMSPATTTMKAAVLLPDGAP
ncbi:hypothetical protein AiwAL_05245 [Acidiphilium sp. AL]|uniref:Magnesium transporter MgtE intracellular domain-containing protein n=1 Tax=Acidiphilium iwatense TaxID=768198 RepID=A0ABS9DSH8_9PROT|nr:hypothetical protein [Acidiphilium sp. AL]MCF3945688.1 hypothetical protein [Acidiphilium iwatense]MCU4159509.1 hypothetical protein [Acidiphilium sp. AL]